MGEREADSKILSGSTIVGIVIGTGITFIVKSIEPQTKITETLLTAVPTITLVADKLMQKWEQKQNRKRHIESLDEALSRVKDYLQNPVTPEQEQKLQAKMTELQIATIDAVQYNPNQPPSN